jgi:hypothetical protein
MYLLQVFFFLFFGPEDGGDIFLRNVGWLSAEKIQLFVNKQVIFIMFGFSIQQLGWNSGNCKRLLLTALCSLPKLPRAVRIRDLTQSDKDARIRAPAEDLWS